MGLLRSYVNPQVIPDDEYDPFRASPSTTSVTPWSSTAPENQPGMTAVQRLMQIDPQFRQIYEMYGRTLAELNRAATPGYDDQEARRRSQQIMTSGLDEWGTGTGPGINPATNLPFTWESAYAFALGEIRKDRDQLGQESTRLSQEVSRAITDARNAGRVGADASSIIPILGPPGQDGTQPIIARMTPNGTITNAPSEVLERFYGVSPDQQSRVDSARAGERADLARQQEADREANARNRATIEQQERNRRSQEAIAEAGNALKIADMQLQFRQNLLTNAVANDRITMDVAREDIESLHKQVEDSRTRFQSVIRESNIRDGLVYEAIGKANEWDQKEIQFAADYARQLWTEEKRADVTDRATQGGYQREQMQVARDLAVKAQEGFKDAVKNFIPYRSDMADVVQKGLVAIAAGMRVPKGFIEAFNIDPREISNQIMDVGEQAMRRYLNRPTGPMLPDLAPLPQRPPPPAYTPRERTPYPELSVTPEMIARMGESGYTPEILDQIDSALAPLRNRPVTGYIDSQMQNAGMVPPPPIEEPLIQVEEPMPIEEPMPFDEGNEGADLDAIIAQMGGMGGGPMGLPMMGGMGQGQYRNPMDIETAWRSPDENPIVRQMDSLTPYMDPDMLAGTGVAIARMFLEDVSPQEAWETGFPDQPWMVGEDDYSYDDDWDTGGEWYA